MTRNAYAVRVRGLVQGVGFRPNVLRLANLCGVTGDVRNDSDGVLIHASGDPAALERFISLVQRDVPRLARITSVEVTPPTSPVASDAFHIVASETAGTHTQIAPDAAMCADCAAEVRSPAERRYRYPFTNCTNCGPRLSIVEKIPYDRANTTMDSFTLCDACAAQYGDVADRRFHAQPIACHRCGPVAKLSRMDGAALPPELRSALDDIDATQRLLQAGAIVAIKGLGGFHLACDATNAEAVATLRVRKSREEKPFALMASDIAMVRRYCSVSDTEATLLRSAAAPIVLLAAGGPERLPPAVAPGSVELGFMLPSTPLAMLLMDRMGRPLVMTSGNRSSEPQAIASEAVRERLRSIADYVLDHDRAIANRVDDSLVRVVRGETRMIRRARGYAPEPIVLPPGFERAPDLIALGAELKATFCLVLDGTAVLSQHQGDLEDAATYDEYRRNLALYEGLFHRAPSALAIDRHPEYLSSKYGRERSRREAVPLAEVQHHHAHIASVLAERGRPLAAPPVLGIALDGLGYGDDGELWGGEFLIADYRDYRRVGTFKPVPLLGGARAMREPWRNTYAHLVTGMGWAEFRATFQHLDLYRYLEAKPRAMLDAMIANDLNAPMASSCGRLFDAVAAALGLAPDRSTFEGQAAMLLEAAVDREIFGALTEADSYIFEVRCVDSAGLPYIDPLGMWHAILTDLERGVPTGTIAARFHFALARAIAHMAVAVTTESDRGDNEGVDTIALSGGCFQNTVLLEAVTARLEALGFTVLTNARVPANDGGIALGQAAIAAATLIATNESANH